MKLNKSHRLVIQSLAKGNQNQYVNIECINSEHRYQSSKEYKTTINDLLQAGYIEKKAGSGGLFIVNSKRKKGKPYSNEATAPYLPLECRLSTLFREEWLIIYSDKSLIMLNKKMIIWQVSKNTSSFVIPLIGLLAIIVAILLDKC